MLLKKFDPFLGLVVELFSTNLKNLTKHLHLSLKHYMLRKVKSKITTPSESDASSFVNNNNSQNAIQ